MKQIIFLTVYFLFLSCKHEEVLANESINVSISPRIVGGQNADIILNSYTLALRYLGDLFCTAFAVSNLDVLSAAHCFSDLEPQDYPDVTVHSRTVHFHEIGRVHKVKRITIHPKYTGNWNSDLLHDIVHILLDEESELELDENQLKADLPTEDVGSDSKGIMAGWGCTTPYADVLAERLQMLEMRIISYKDCQNQLKKTNLKKYHLCAIGSAGHGCAQGDSGGPLMVGNVAVGIHSWCLKGKCGAGLPEIFTNIFQEKDFLKSVMWEYPTESSSSSPTSSPELQFMGKKPRRESANRKKSAGWFRKIMCAAP